MTETAATRSQLFIRFGKPPKFGKSKLWTAPNVYYTALVGKFLPGLSVYRVKKSGHKFVVDTDDINTGSGHASLNELFYRYSQERSLPIYLLEGKAIRWKDLNEKEQKQFEHFYPGSDNYYVLGTDGEPLLRDYKVINNNLPITSLVCKAIGFPEDFDMQETAASKDITFQDDGDGVYWKGIHIGNINDPAPRAGRKEYRAYSSVSFIPRYTLWKTKGKAVDWLLSIYKTWRPEHAADAENSFAEIAGVKTKFSNDLEVYHGTAKAFNDFDIAAKRKSSTPSYEIPGVFFTPSSEEAFSHARRSARAEGGIPRVIKATLNLKNPKNVTSAIKKYRKTLGLTYGEAKNKAYTEVDRKVHDGVIHDGDAYNNPEYVVFDPKAINIVRENAKSKLPKGSVKLKESAAVGDVIKVGPEVREPNTQVDHFRNAVAEFMESEEVAPSTVWQYIKTNKGKATLLINDKTYAYHKPTAEIYWLLANDRGAGRAAMETICELADNFQVYLVLDAAPLQANQKGKEFRLSVPKLVKFYKHFKFTKMRPLKGDIYPRMIRKPRQETAELHRKLQISNEYHGDGPDNLKKYGLGWVGANADVDYKGIKVHMRPSVFLKLAAYNSSLKSDFIENHIRDGKPIASPFLQIEVPDAWFDGDFSALPRVTGHEGRHRMFAVNKVYGDIPVEVHLFPHAEHHQFRRRNISNINDWVKALDRAILREETYLDAPVTNTIE